MGTLLQVPSDRDRNRALDIFDRVTDKAGIGSHALTLGVTGIGGTAIALFPFVQDDEGMAANGSDLYVFCDLLAIALSGAHPSGLLLRTMGQPQTVCGWRFTDGDPLPLTRAEAFDAYTIHPDTDGPLIPLPGTEYADAPVIHI
ncbi:hypothetical protein [Streptomyces sp. NBC_01166]|uniref:hypothetical protein n=1 Tax=unclassified Streptomyces TaxID=2593676 RepID=UPI002F914A46|nr:hypothetical protein OG379_39580 [Streptomyces sp. NBC_01166]WST35539.1 hypothetical protein OG379_41410 [Streptomyces sp. NBC_01166]